ncbi:hypothetical protein BJX68DRAFT_273107 [Aspergillus pseudodeflectus]|uniref:Rhodopsin domain-containing protein n=1 Tax=Aspergillus pseudodeflectus TaxID=176178 RepID=A0ABR4JBK3_9EURO
MALIFMVASWAIKVSFCLTLYKVVHRTVYTASVVGVAVVTTDVTCFECLWTVFFCNPVQAFWLSRDPASCKNPTAWLISMYVHGITIMCADIALGIVVPILLLRRMHLQLALKISVGLTLAVGSLASAATIIRMVYNGDIMDPTRNFLVSNLALWMSVEVGVSIICTSAVALKPLLKKARIIQGSNRPADPATLVLGPNDQRIEYDVDFSLTSSDSQQQGIALEARASNRERELSVETLTPMGKATMEYL